MHVRRVRGAWSSTPSPSDGWIRQGFRIQRKCERLNWEMEDVRDAVGLWTNRNPLLGTSTVYRLLWLLSWSSGILGTFVILPELLACNLTWNRQWHPKKTTHVLKCLLSKSIWANNSQISLVAGRGKNSSHRSLKRVFVAVHTKTLCQSIMVSASMCSP